MTTEVSKAIKKYLDSVKRHIGDRTASEQAELIRQLEEHIHEAIHQAPNTPISNIIAQMDPPESFGESDERRPPSSAVLGRLTLGHLSLLLMIIAVATPFVLMALSALIRGNIGSIINVGLPLGVLLLIVALAMGIVARKERSGRVTIIAALVILALLTFFIPVNRVVSNSPEPEQSIILVETGIPDQSENSHSE